MIMNICRKPFQSCFLLVNDVKFLYLSKYWECNWKKHGCQYNLKLHLWPLSFILRLFTEILSMVATTLTFISARITPQSALQRAYISGFTSRPPVPVDNISLLTALKIWQMLLTTPLPTNHQSMFI